jgi:glycogen synthase
MRIALATSSYAPYVGGVETHVREVARELTVRGHEVAVWTVARDGMPSTREVDGIPVLDLPTPLPSRSARGAWRFLSRTPAALTTWLRAWRRLRPDVVNVQCFGPNGTYAQTLARTARTALVVSSHGETLADDGGVFGASALARRSLRTALAHADGVTGCSPVVIADLESRFRLRAGVGRIVPNGAAPAPTASAPPGGLPRRYLAAVGRLERMKGFDLLLDAFAEARLPGDIGLVVGGDGTQATALRAQAEHRGISDRVLFTGMLTPAEVSGLLAGATATIVPSRFEAFGIAVLESWRAGSPLVAADRGGLPDLVADGEDGLLVDPEDTAAFARRLVEIVADRTGAAERAARGRSRAREFTWERTADGYEELYERVIRERRRR